MREHAQPRRSRSSARRCGSLLPARTRGRCNPAPELRRRDRRPAFPDRRCRSGAVPFCSLRIHQGGGGHAHSSRRRPVRRAIPPGRDGRAHTGSMAGEVGSGSCGRSGCRRRSGGRAWFPRRPSRPPTRLCSALLAAGRARADRAGGAKLAAGAAVGHPGGCPPLPAAPAAFRHDLLVLVIAGRADSALGTPSIDPPSLAATSACPLAITGCAGAADPARGGLAPQVGRDPAAPGAGRGRDCLIPGIRERVGQSCPNETPVSGTATPRAWGKTLPRG